jgi:hypothetical protein
VSEGVRGRECGPRVRPPAWACALQRPCVDR